MASEVSSNPSETSGEELTNTDYWIKRWDEGRTGWHNNDLNQLLKENVDQLFAGRHHIRILVPLCGKAIELKWFADLGNTVVGIDCSTLGIEVFFKENSLDYEKQPMHEIDGFVYKAVGSPITIYCCDLFSFKIELEEKFDAIWDRGSLVAIPPKDRLEYRKFLLSLMTAECRYLLEGYEYDDTVATGPPHCIKETTVLELYGDVCNCQKIASMKDPERHRTCAPNSEYFNVSLWLITLK
jgi:thiopurine S-methyltransferase